MAARGIVLGTMLLAGCGADAPAAPARVSANEARAVAEARDMIPPDERGGAKVGERAAR